MQKMRIIYPDERIPKNKKSIFLGGTIALGRKSDWRKEAIQKLEKAGYDGIVFNPDYTDIPKEKQNSYEEQILWEINAIKACTAAIFWIDRDLKKRPGLTTNVEFGYWLNTGKVFYGRPDTSEKCFYLDYIYKLQGFSNPSNNLDDLIKITLKNI